MEEGNKVQVKVVKNNAMQAERKRRHQVRAAMRACREKIKLESFFLPSGPRTGARGGRPEPEGGMDDEPHDSAPYERQDTWAATQREMRMVMLY